MSETPFDLAGVLAKIHERTAIRHRVCIDPDLRAAIDDAQAALDKAKSDHKQAEKRAETAREDAYMSETVADPSSEAVEQAQAALDAAKEAAAGAEVTVVFRSWLGDEYDQLVRDHAKAHADGGQILLDQWTNFAKTAYQRVEDPNGEPIDFTWEQASTHLLNAGDRMKIGQQVVAANETPTSIPT